MKFSDAGIQRPKRKLGKTTSSEEFDYRPELSSQADGLVQTTKAAFQKPE